jgi:hypothetical protein
MSQAGTGFNLQARQEYSPLTKLLGDDVALNLELVTVGKFRRRSALSLHAALRPGHAIS